MKDFPARPLTKDQKNSILAEAMSSCREKECVELFIEVQEILKEMGIHPTFDLIQEILNI